MQTNRTYQIQNGTDEPFGIDFLRLTAREMQVRRLRLRHGLTHRQADLLAGMLFGEGAL